MYTKEFRQTDTVISKRRDITKLHQQPFLWTFIS